MSDGHTQAQKDRDQTTIMLLSRLAKATGTDGTGDDVLRGSLATITRLSSEAADLRAELEEYRLRLAGALIASEGGNGCPDDAIEAIRTCPTIKSVMALRADLADREGMNLKLTAELVRVKADLARVTEQRDAALAEVERVKEIARNVVNACHLRTHGFPEGDISDLDHSKLLPAIVALEAALTPPAQHTQGD